jgi:hypothetical protein
VYRFKELVENDNSFIIPAPRAAPRGAKNLPAMTDREVVSPCGVGRLKPNVLVSEASNTSFPDK